MSLHNLKPAPGSRPPKRIVGRGEGSTLGQTCGKGQKGQTCRSGEGRMPGFEGGQTPLMRRIPKRGFTHSSKVRYQPVDIRLLEKKFSAGDEINASALCRQGILRSDQTPFKILGKGKISKSFQINAAHVSQSAREAIEKAGGRVIAPVS